MTICTNHNHINNVFFLIIQYRFLNITVKQALLQIG